MYTCSYFTYMDFRNGRLVGIYRVHEIKVQNGVIKSTAESVIPTICYEALRGARSVEGLPCGLLLVESFSWENSCSRNFPLVTNHPIMVRVTEAKKETIDPT